jgi:Acetyltransferase (GNAT) family
MQLFNHVIDYYVIFVKENHVALKNLPSYDKFEIRQWHPSLFNIFPDGCFGNFFFFYYWLFFFFSSKKHSVWLAYDHTKMIHHSVIFPYFYKFPFMHKKDVQVGMIHTDSNYRNQGIANTVLGRISEAHRSKIWYISKSDNIESINLARKNSFTLYGTAYKKREKSLILDLLNIYKLKP